MTLIWRLLLVMSLGLIASGCLSGSQIEHGNVAFDVSPDGSRIVFSAADGDLYFFEIQTSQVKRLTRSKKIEFEPGFSPDGKAVIYANGAPGKKGDSLYLLSASGGTPRRLTNDEGVWDSAPSYSPDGARVVFVRAHRYRPYSMGGMVWSDYDVYVINLDGSGLRRITRQNYYGIARPRFLPGLDEVFYAADEPYDTPYFKKDMGGSMRTILRVPADGSSQPSPVLPLPKPGLQLGALGTDLDFNQGGKLVTFISDKAVPFEYDICTMRPDGTEIRMLNMTKTSHYNQSPIFLPGGKGILFLAGTETNAGSRPIFSLWQVDIDGKNPRMIADSGLFTNPARWQPKQKPSSR